MLTAEQFVRKFKDVKTLPYVVTKLSRMIADDDTTMKDLEDVIKMDPTLVARLLRLVNSAFYGLSQPVISIGRVVAFLGMRNLRSIAATDSLQNLFKERNSAGIFSRKRQQSDQYPPDCAVHYRAAGLQFPAGCRITPFSPTGVPSSGKYG
ncbi:MAG: HDOD domain-containing protein [Desulfobulbaceae bacterium]